MRAFITGVSGSALEDEERAFLREAQPWGLILFKRNVAAPDALRRLIDEVRTTLGRAAPVLIDQEGGRVQRLGPPLWPAYPPGAAYGVVYDGDRQTGLAAAKLGARLIAADLAPLGIDVDCMPIADLRVAGADPVVGDRAYGNEPAKVAAIAGAIAQGLTEGGVLPVRQAHPRPRPGDRGQPHEAACGQRRPRCARGDRFRRFPSARGAATRHDGACCIHSDRPHRAGDRFANYSA